MKRRRGEAVIFFICINISTYLILFALQVKLPTYLQMVKVNLRNSCDVQKPNIYISMFLDIVDPADKVASISRLNIPKSFSIRVIHDLQKTMFLVLGSWTIRILRIRQKPGYSVCHGILSFKIPDIRPGIWQYRISGLARN